MMISQVYLNVLRKLYARVSNAEVSWAVTGSLGLALQGLPLEPRDIDIQTDEAGAYKIERLFPESVTKKVRFSPAERVRSHLGALLIDGIKVEIMGDIEKRLSDGMWEPPPDLAHHRRFVEVEEMQVPVLSLEYEQRAYLKLGRTEQAEMLRRWVQDNNGPT